MSLSKNGKTKAPDRGLSIVYRRLDAIAHMPRNAKGHDVGAIVAAIREFGIIDPIGLNGR